MTMTVRLSVLFFALWVLAGCASHTARKDPADINWRERVGTYTYRQAQADYGVPSKVEKSSDGTVAEWVLRPTRTSELGAGSGFAGSQSASSIGRAQPRENEREKLRLKFGSDGKLIE